MPCCVNTCDIKTNPGSMRLGRLEVAIAGLRKDVAFGEEHSAEQSVRMDQLVGRIERIERRLDLG